MLVTARRFLVGLVVLGILSACAGRTANPVIAQQYGDDKKTCQALQAEMLFIKGEIQRLIPQTDKTGKNVALGVAGFFLLVPLFFMDLSQAEQMEIDAYRQRYNHLLIIAGDKQCGIEGQPIPDFKQSTPPNTNVYEKKN